MTRRTYKMMARAIYLGLDSSTQGLKATAIDYTTQVLYTSSVNYDRDLPQYGTHQGVHDHGNARVTTPTLMLAHALDTLLDKMKADAFPFEKVVAVSGSGQQHGSVYWKTGSSNTLALMTWEQPLHRQLHNCFAIEESPIWMDSSTTNECREFEAAAGGAKTLATITGSRAYERFTANQILKIKRQQPDAYKDTERISLISSFMCSLFLGAYAPIDTSDAAGMNLLNINTLKWDMQLASIIDDNLHWKLGTPIPPYSVVGTIAPFFVGRYGFSPSCSIVAWSGDNPNSVAGICLSQAGDVGISLGTSDTIFSIVPASCSRPGLEGHFFPNPIDPSTNMAMLCYKNGSLAREGVAARVAEGSWEKFSELVASLPAGNDGYIGFFIDHPEIIPTIIKTGIYRFDQSNRQINSFPSDAHEARAILEGQFLSMRLHKEALGLDPKRIFITGGASTNPTICQTIADIFGCEVYACAQTDSASLGAAYRAKHADMCNMNGQFVPFLDGLADRNTRNLPNKEIGRNTEFKSTFLYNHTKVASPRESAHIVYSTMMERYRELEAAVVTQANP